MQQTIKFQFKKNIFQKHFEHTAQTIISIWKMFIQFRTNSDDFHLEPENFICCLI